MNKYKFLILLFLLSSGVESNADTEESSNSSFSKEAELTEVEQAQLNEQLRRAAQNTELQKLEELLNKGADINFQNQKGETVLMIVASSIRTVTDKRFDTINFLLEKGADVNIQDHEGRTVLMIVASLKLNKAVKIFVNHKGTKINIQDHEGRTALMWASSDGFLSSVDILINNGADVNIKDKQRRTALIYAVENLKVNIVEKLAQYTNEKSWALEMALNKERIIKNSNHRPYDSSAIKDIKQILRTYLNKTPITVESTILTEAEKTQTPDEIESTELTKAEKTQTPDEIESTELTKAEKTQTPDEIESTELTKAEQDQLNKQLRKAAKKGDIQKLEKLLNKGANINFQNIYGETILMIVTSSSKNRSSLSGKVASTRETWNFSAYNNEDLIRFLLRKRANMHIQDKKGQTALMMAASQKNLLRLFDHDLHNSILLSKTDHHGWTALMYAIDNVMIDNVKALSKTFFHWNKMLQRKTQDLIEIKFRSYGSNKSQIQVIHDILNTDILNKKSCRRIF